LFKLSNIGYKFGGCSEREMMLEMKKHGPIAVSFEPDYMFSMYKGGIYSFGNNNDYMLKGLPKPEWTKVDHAGFKFYINKSFMLWMGRR
jgi:hypothetical protein